MQQPRSDQLRGVNLGGWLVVEPWMTPGLFADSNAVDETTLVQTAGGREIIRRHRETFITEADFAWIAETGLDLVRIPVGHWAVRDAPPYLSSVELLDAAMDWAQAYGLKVLLDLHGAAGSQNGRDHSGLVGPRSFYRSAAYREDSLDALTGLAERYAAHPALWGIEMLNEPMDLRIWRLWEFHHRAYRRLTEVLRPGTHIVFADGFVPLLTSGSLRGNPDFPVVLDCHFYQAFYPWDTRKTYEQHLVKARQRAKLIARLQRHQPVLIGEWSAGMDSRAVAGRSESPADLARGYVDAQLDGYSGALGWCYWSYKTATRDDWNFRYQVETGVIEL
ncbi:MAG: cellulase family glycosylhydrolase [Microlunatus sp.]